MSRSRTSYTMAMAGLVLVALVPACGTTTGGWAWTSTMVPDPTNPTVGTITGIDTKNALCCGSINFTLTNGGIVRDVVLWVD